MEESQKPLRLKDCEIDWTHHPVPDANGNIIYDDITHLRDEWIIEDCECNEYCLADLKCCFKYYTFDYDENLYRQYMKQNGISEHSVSYWGLQKMFDDGWLKSPAFVKWKDILWMENIDQVRQFVEGVNDPDMKVKIVKHFIDNADYLYGKKDKHYYIPELKNLLIIYSEAARIRNEEIKRQQAKKITNREEVDILKELNILKERLRKLEKQPRVNVERHYGPTFGDVDKIQVVPPKNDTKQLEP